MCPCTHPKWILCACPEWVEAARFALWPALDALGRASKRENNLALPALGRYGLNEIQVGVAVAGRVILAHLAAADERA